MNGVVIGEDSYIRDLSQPSGSREVPLKMTSWASCSWSDCFTCRTTLAQL